MSELATAPAPATHPTRVFGRFELRRLLGKSVGSMVWLAFDPGAGQEVMLTLPRVQPPDSAALDRWTEGVRLAARLNHPNLVPVLETGVQDHWPYVVAGRDRGVTLGEWIDEHPNPSPLDVVGWLGDALQGLAFAHEAGSAHHDLQLHSLLIDERGAVGVMALAASGVGGHGGFDATDATPRRSNDRAMAFDPNLLRAQRDAATRDVLACGLLLHHLITGQPPLDQPDTALVMARMTPVGKELVRLPWSTPLPIPEALRAIANRCTAGQERLRYHGARTLLGALTGWRDAHSHDGGGPVALLLDRLQTVGHLPALPGLGGRVTRVTSLETQRTDEIAEEVLEDLSLSFELLRTLNSAQVQGTQIAGNGPVLTLRRIISLIGINGVRLAANTLREWPGPLSAPHAEQLRKTFDRVRLAGHTAQALRPAGYDPQVVYLITVLQNLGRLMLCYHFADEAEQIQQLMKATPANREAGIPEQAGLTEEAAAYAVLGVDIETLGTAVARQWGLIDEVLHMIRRLPPDVPVRRPDGDLDILRITANAANEAVDAVSSLEANRVGAALAHVAQRHARALAIVSRDVSDALQAGREVMRKGVPMPAPRRAAAVRSDEDATIASSFADLPTAADPPR